MSEQPVRPGVERTDCAYLWIVDPALGARTMPVPISHRARHWDDWHAGTAEMMPKDHYRRG